MKPCPLSVACMSSRKMGLPISEPIPGSGHQCVTLEYRQSRPAIMVYVSACLYDSDPEPKTFFGKFD